MAHLCPDMRSLSQIFAFQLLHEGEIPQHFSIIMDGNRRFAESHGMQRKVGHQAGVQKAKEIIRLGYDTSLSREITLYAFSIENFKRSQDQVSELMGLIHDYCNEIVGALSEAKKFDVCVQFIGNWDLIPAKLKPEMARIMLETRHCKTYKINLAVAYTGRNGIERSMRSIERGIKDGDLVPEDVCEYLVDEAQNLMPMRPVDILLRTGGDTRISDFMMWEASHAYIHFVDTAWPELTFWELWDAVVKYQMFRRHVPKQAPSEDSLTVKQKNRMDKFLEKIRDKKWTVLAKFAEKSNITDFNVRCYEDTFFRDAVKKLLAF